MARDWWRDTARRVRALERRGAGREINPIRLDPWIVRGAVSTDGGSSLLPGGLNLGGIGGWVQAVGVAPSGSWSRAVPTGMIAKTIVFGQAHGAGDWLLAVAWAADAYRVHDTDVLAGAASASVLTIDYSTAGGVLKARRLRQPWWYVKRRVMCGDGVAGMPGCARSLPSVTIPLPWGGSYPTIVTGWAVGAGFTGWADPVIPPGSGNIFPVTPPEVTSRTVLAQWVTQFAPTEVTVAAPGPAGSAAEGWAVVVQGVSP